MIDNTPRFPVIIPVTLSAKKGDIQPFFLGIVENIPAPCIESTYTRRWQGLETLTIPAPGSQCTRLPGTYRGTLLYREGDNFHACQTGSRSPLWRGKACGQVSIDQYTGPGKVITKCSATHSCQSGENWLSQGLIPIFQSSTIEHAGKLRQHALNSLRRSFLDGIARLRKDADAREQEAILVMAALGSSLTTA